MDTSKGSGGSGAERLLLYGGIPHSYLKEWHITSDLELAAAKLDVAFEIVSHEVLKAHYENPTPAQQARTAQLLARLIDDGGSSGAGGPSLRDLEKAVRLFVAMHAICRTRSGDALTIVCTPWIEETLAPVPCVAITFFQEQGVPAACQGDLDALLTMVLFQRAGAHPTFMGGARVSGRNLILSHCALCRTLAGPVPQPYTIRDYHGQKPSPTLATRLPIGGKVTLARLTENLESLLLTTGRVRGMRSQAHGCANAISLEVASAERIADAVLGRQNHYVLAWGDHTEALRASAEARAIPVIPL